jgi:AraC-like DNA-binding protein
MEYVKTTLRDELTVKKIVTVHYFEYARNYVFEGESHDFWEFLVVDKGEVEVMAGTNGYRLKQGEIIFHKPKEFHNVWANGVVAPNLVVVAFECNSPAMRYFENKILAIGDAEKNLLAQMIREARSAFSSRLDDPSLKKLERNPDSPVGCEQFIRIYLEQMLLGMIRKGGSIKPNSKLSSSVKERSDGDMAKRIIEYLQDHLLETISFNEVCRFSSLSGTNLKVLFREKTGMSVMEYFKKLKIDEAKKMIREGEHNFTQIAQLLGYSSIHYFSRHFKKATGMTPSQYASSVMVKLG